MNDRESLDPIIDLPAELAELDAELGAIRIAERASFSPELHAELRRQTGGVPPSPSGGDWIRPTSPARWGVVAATFAALLIAVAVPPVAVTSISVLIQRLEAVLPAAQGGRGEVVPVAVPSPTPAAPRPTLSTVGTARAADPFRPVRLILPRALDLVETQNAIRRLYPRSLQRADIGGIVHVQFHVDSTGGVMEALVDQGSGWRDLDKAALDAAPLMRFQPATWDGRPFSTWVAFDIVFEPSVDAPPAGLAGGDAGDVSLEIPYELFGGGASPIMQETLELLQSALGDSALTDRLGGIDGLAHGEPPMGTDPFAWRERAGQALEKAIRRAPDNPAPFLALARIRRKQGLPDESRTLLEQGSRRAELGGITVSPRLTAELRYELAEVAREAWRTWEYLGRLPAEALAAGTCARARTSSASGEVTPETLIAWNYVCPEELRRILDARFRDAGAASAVHEDMVRSLRATVAADPDHMRANVDLLLDLAERSDHVALLNGARRFAVESRGHPYARLLTGLALEAVGQPEEALTQLQAGLAGLPRDDADRIRDIRPLLEPEAAQRLSALSPAVRAEAEETFWLTQDPLLSTEVNERLVAHLARSVFAYFRLGGSHTDAGSVWLRYGAPLRIRAVGEGTVLRTGFWDYGSGPAITFQRPAASTTLDLTPEGRAYLFDLRTTRPGVSGVGGRVIQALPAEVARFKNANGAIEMEVAALVPNVLGVGARPISVSLFQLDARGRKLFEQHVIVQQAAVVKLRAVADRSTREIAVEIVDPSVPYASAARLAIGGQLERAPSPVSLEIGGESTGPTVSDLQLVKAGARPRRDVTRKPDPFEPLAEHVVATPDFGLVFEVYDLPSRRPYELKVNLLPAGGGRVPLAFLPSGETRWGLSFVRNPSPQPARSTEYMSVRMPDVSPGSYRVQVVVGLEDRTWIEVERVIDRK